MRLAWPLIGRTDQLDAVARALRAPELAGVMVYGPAGVGKSRVVREAMILAATHGYTTHMAIGTSASMTLPAAAFAAWVPPAKADSLQVARAVIDQLTRSGPPDRVIVCVDDVHLLDDLSTFIVQQLIHRRAAKVVLTARTGDHFPAATQRFATDEFIERIELPPLTHRQTSDLLTATLGSAVADDVVSELWRVTEGNTLYLRTIVESEIDEQRLIQLDGRWTWEDSPEESRGFRPSRAGIPPTLVAMVESKIGALTGTVSDVIDSLAVGEPLTLAALVRITDLAAVETADRAGLLAFTAQGHEAEVRLAHPLYGEIRRRHAPVTSLRRLRGRVAAELAKLDEDPRLVMRRAALLMESDEDVDADLLLRAAQCAVQCADLTLADHLAAEAVRSGAGAEAVFLRAHILSIVSRTDEALALLDDISRDGISAADRAQAAFLRSHVTLFPGRDPARAKSLIDAAASTTEDQARGCVDAFLALYWSVRGYPLQAIEWAQRFDLNALPSVIGAGTAMALSVAYGAAGHTEQAVRAAHTGYAIAGRSFDAAQMRFVVADGHIGALLLAGRVTEAVDTAEEFHAEAADLIGPAQLFSSGQLGIVRLAEGRLAEACGLLAGVVDAFTASGDTTGWGYRFCLPLTTAFAMRGQGDEAAATLAALRRLRHPTWDYLDYEYAIADAWVTAETGAVSVAVTVVLAAVEKARSAGQAAAVIALLQTAAQLGAADLPSTTVTQLPEGPRAGDILRFAAGLIHRDGSQLGSVSGDLESIGDLVGAADAAAHAAAIYRADGLKGRANTWSVRAERLADRCGANTPAIRAIRSTLPITDREREVATLIAHGLSTKDIAERLTVSQRTVEGHLYRAMAKTGATTRAELASMVTDVDG